MDESNAALDVKDAHLEVCGLKSARRDLVFLKMIPGQCEGSQQWFAHFCEHLGEHFEVEKCKE